VRRDCRKYEEINNESNDINSVYCTFIRKEDTLIHWALGDLCCGRRKVLLSGSESKACCAHYGIDPNVFVLR